MFFYPVPLPSRRGRSGKKTNWRSNALRELHCSRATLDARQHCEGSCLVRSEGWEAARSIVQSARHFRAARQPKSLAVVMVASERDMGEQAIAIGRSILPASTRVPWGAVRIESPRTSAMRKSNSIIRSPLFLNLFAWLRSHPKIGIDSARLTLAAAITSLHSRAPFSGTEFVYYPNQIGLTSFAPDQKHKECS